MKFAWQWLLLMNLARAPEGTEGGDPAVDPAVDPAADPAVADPAADPADPAVDPAVADPAPIHGNKGKTPWYMDRIHKETNAKNAERDARLAAERRAADAEALAARLAAGGDPAPAAPARQPAQEQDIEQLVEQRASQKRLYEDTNDILVAGNSAFDDFTQSRQILYAIGATTDEFIADLVAVDKANAHKILDKLAKDPEKAASLVSMDPRRRTAELTRLSMAEGAKPAAAAPAAPAAPAIPISKAPKPAAPLAPAAGTPESDGLGDEVDDKTWSENFDKKFLKRA